MVLSEFGTSENLTDLFCHLKMTTVATGSLKSATISSMTNSSSQEAQAHSQRFTEPVLSRRSLHPANMDLQILTIQTRSTWALETCQRPIPQSAWVELHLVAQSTSTRHSTLREALVVIIQPKRLHSMTSVCNATNSKTVWPPLSGVVQMPGCSQLWVITEPSASTLCLLKRNTEFCFEILRHYIFDY